MNPDEMSYEQLQALCELNGDVDKGYSPETIAMARTYKLPNLVDENDEPKSCCICMTEFEEEDDLMVIKCAHEMHYSCLVDSLTNNKECPICKTPCLD